LLKLIEIKTKIFITSLACYYAVPNIRPTQIKNQWSEKFKDQNKRLKEEKKVPNRNNQPWQKS